MNKGQISTSVHLNEQFKHTFNPFQTKTTRIAANGATSIPEALSLVSCCYDDTNSKATATSYLSKSNQTQFGSLI